MPWLLAWAWGRVCTTCPSGESELRHDVACVACVAPRCAAGSSSTKKNQVIPSSTKWYQVVVVVRSEEEMWRSTRAFFEGFSMFQIPCSIITEAIGYRNQNWSHVINSVLSIHQRNKRKTGVNWNELVHNHDWDQVLLLRPLLVHCCHLCYLDEKSDN